MSDNPLVDGLVAYYAEEAEEDARQCEWLRSKGAVLKMTKARIPDLNPDGSLSEKQTTYSDYSENAFCATGDDGGQDNSCSPTGSGGKLSMSPALQKSKTNYKWSYSDGDGSYATKSNDGKIKILIYQGDGDRVATSQKAEWVGHIIRDKSVGESSTIYGRTLGDVKKETTSVLSYHDSKGDEAASPTGSGGGKVKIDFSSSLKITNLDQLPRGVGAKAKYLEAVHGPNGSYIAKQWREKPPAKYEVLIKMPPMRRSRRAD